MALVLWNTNIFFEKFKVEERKKVEIWANAQTELEQSSLDEELGVLPLMIMANNTSTPMILVNKEGAMRPHNLPEKIAKDTAALNEMVAQFKTENEPISSYVDGEVLQTIYYGDSDVLTKLKYYPMALLLIILLFGIVIYFIFKSNKVSEQNKLWVGMAKETAHQIGTPLTSLLGWNELLKTKNINPEISQEIEKDISRLQTITERFSKIGSKPTLEKLDLVDETQKAFDYLAKRNSKLIQFQLNIPTSRFFWN